MKKILFAIHARFACSLAQLKLLFFISTGSLERRDKRQSWAASSTASLASTSTLIAANETGGQSDVGNLLDTFPPVTLTVSSFFKQEGDKVGSLYDIFFHIVDWFDWMEFLTTNQIT